MSGLPVLQQGLLRAAAADAPAVPLTALDQLWFQVSGTVCNLRCAHCFISCSPDNQDFWFMGRERVREHLEASVALGVKEYYFTGGEPFMNREILGILEDALALGPTTVLTNGTLLPPRTVDAGRQRRCVALLPRTARLPGRRHRGRERRHPRSRLIPPCPGRN